MIFRRISEIDKVKKKFAQNHPENQRFQVISVFGFFALKISLKFKFDLIRPT